MYYNSAKQLILGPFIIVTHVHEGIRRYVSDFIFRS